MVGSAIVRELQRQGYTNIITRTHKELDLTRQDAVEEFFAQEKPEYVFLAAAKVGGIVANQEALADFMYDNMTLEMNAIHSAWKNGCKKLEFLGSSCIYPRMAPQPMQESCLLTSELEKTNEAYELIDFVDYEDLFNKYDTLNKISFDYAVVEHEPEIEVMRFTGTWKDLGTWNTLTGAMDGHVVGEAMLNEKCENVHVVNELDVPILCMGLKDVVVSASPEGILVSDKEQSSYIKPFVNMLDHRVMFAEKSWGSFKVIDIDKESMTIKVTLNAGHRMNYHSHQHRDEVWTVIAGKGKTIVDGMEQNVKAGDVITMSAGCRHTVIAETELKLIEVQLGKEIDVNDKQKFELEY